MEFDRGRGMDTGRDSHMEFRTGTDNHKEWSMEFRRESGKGKDSHKEWSMEFRMGKDSHTGSRMDKGNRMEFRMGSDTDKGSHMVSHRVLSMEFHKDIRIDTRIHIHNCKDHNYHPKSNKQKLMRV